MFYYLILLPKARLAFTIFNYIYEADAKNAKWLQTLACQLKIKIK